LIFQTIISPDN